MSAVVTGAEVRDLRWDQVVLRGAGQDRLMPLESLPLPAPRAAASPARLLLLHGDNPRLLAALEALVAAGFTVSGAACPRTALLWIETAGPPDALLVPPDLADLAAPGAAPGVADSQADSAPTFADAMLSRFPQLHVIRLQKLPWPQRPDRHPREHLLPLPFSAAHLARLLAAMRG